MSDHAPNFLAAREDLQDFADSITNTTTQLLQYSNRIIDEWRLTDILFRTNLAESRNLSLQNDAQEAVHRKLQRELNDATAKLKAAEKEAKYAKGREAFYENENRNFELRIRAIKSELKEQLKGEVEPRREANASYVELRGKMIEYFEMREKEKGVEMVNQSTQTVDGDLARASQSSGSDQYFEDAVAHLEDVESLQAEDVESPEALSETHRAEDAKTLLQTGPSIGRVGEIEEHGHEQAVHPNDPGIQFEAAVPGKAELSPEPDPSDIPSHEVPDRNNDVKCSEGQAKERLQPRVEESTLQALESDQSSKAEDAVAVPVGNQNQSESQKRLKETRPAKRILQRSEPVQPPTETAWPALGEARLIDITKRSQRLRHAAQRSRK